MYIISIISKMNKKEENNENISEGNTSNSDNVNENGWSDSSQQSCSARTCISYQIFVIGVLPLNYENKIKIIYYVFYLLKKYFLL